MKVFQAFYTGEGRYHYKEIYYFIFGGVYRIYN